MHDIYICIDMILSTFLLLWAVAGRGRALHQTWKQLRILSPQKQKTLSNVQTWAIRLVFVRSNHHGNNRNKARLDETISGTSWGDHERHMLQIKTFMQIVIWRVYFLYYWCVIILMWDDVAIVVWNNCINKWMIGLRNMSCPSVSSSLYIWSLSLVSIAGIHESEISIIFNPEPWKMGPCRQNKGLLQQCVSCLCFWFFWGECHAERPKQE